MPDKQIIQSKFDMTGVKIIFWMIRDRQTCPPERKTTPGTAGGMVRENARTVALATWKHLIFGHLVTTKCHQSVFSPHLWGSLKIALCVVPLGQIAVFYMNIEYLRWCSLLWTRLAWSHHVGLQQGALNFQIVIWHPEFQIWSHIWRGE